MQPLSYDVSDGDIPHLSATRVDSPPHVDGRLDDPAWARAEASDRFTQKLPRDGAPPTDRTTVRVVYDDDNLYVAFDCEQTHAAIVDRLTRRDRIVESDSVAFDLGTRRDGKSAFEFYVNASGVLADAIRFNDTDYSPDWDENWEAETARRPHGWTAEFRIPLRILRFESLPVQSWDFQARRYVSELQETDEWAYHPRTMGGEVSLYGRLDGLVGLRARTPIEFRPFFVLRRRRRDVGFAGDVASGADAMFSAGVDLKWHPTQDLTIDATFNPDFGQVEADQVVLNLTTFETYYPEKRPFFLEGIDAFATPFQLLYSRRIGRVPPLPTLRTAPPYNDQLVDAPEPAVIYGASKVTGRIADGWSIGTLQAVTARDEVQVQLADGTRVSRLADPASSFGVLRLKRDLGSKAYVAFMGTAVTHTEPTGDYPAFGAGTVLCPSGTSVATGARCFNDAYVGGVDWRWRSPRGDYVVSGQVIASTLQRGPVRPIADGTNIQPGDSGYGGQVTLAKEGGEHWTGGGNATAQSRKLDFDDAGYNQRANNYSLLAWGGLRELKPFGPFLEFFIGPSGRLMNNVDGLNLNRVLYLESWAKLRNFWQFYVNAHFRSDRFDDREVGDGTALERAQAGGTELAIGSDPTKRVAFGLDQVTEHVADGFNTYGNARVTVRALPRLDLELLPTWLYTYGEPRFAEYGAQQGQYLFGKQDARSVGVTVRGTWTFFPRLTLQAYAQFFLASGHYTGLTQFTGPAGSTVSLGQLAPFAGLLPQNPDFQQGVLNVNLVLRWEYMLGSTLFLVYTRSQTPTSTFGPTGIATAPLGPNDVAGLDLRAASRAPAADVILVKMAYWWGG